MKNYSLLLLICLAFKPSLVHTMDKKGAIIRAADQDLMRDSRALLTTDGRARAYEELERSPGFAHSDKKLQRSSTEILCADAKALAIDARKKRGTIPDSTKNLDDKIILLAAQKNIERQMALLETVKEENKKEATDQLRVYMSEAYIAILAVDNPTPQEDILTKEEQVAFADLESIYAAAEEDRKILAALEAQPNSDKDDGSTKNNNNNSNINNNNNYNGSAVTKKSTRSSFGEKDDVDDLLTRVDQNYARAEALLARSREEKYREELALSPRAERLEAIMEEIKLQSQARPSATYEIFLTSLQRNAGLFLGKLLDEHNANLHAGIEHMTMTEQAHPVNYVGFTAMLESGVDRTLKYKGKTLLDTAQASGNDMLVQLLTTPHPNKQTLIDLAREHGKKELLPFLLEVPNHRKQNRLRSSLEKTQDHSTSKLDAAVRKVDNIMASVQQRNFGQPVASLDDKTLSLEGRHVKKLILDLRSKMAARPGASYETALAYIRQHPEITYLKVSPDEHLLLNGAVHVTSKRS